MISISLAGCAEKEYQIHDVSVIKEYYEKINNTTDWKKSPSFDERCAIMQIPDDMLNNIDTETLFDAVINYPFFSYINAYTNIQDGVDIMLENFNGIQELAKRSDSPEMILQKYIDEKVLNSDEISELSSQEVVNSVFKLHNMEVILAQDFVTKNLDEDKQEQLKQAVYEKYLAKNKLKAYDGFVLTFFKVCKNENIVFLDFEQDYYSMNINGISVKIE